jgi:hypothetical protein
MFNWYQYSSVCYAFLEDLENIKHLGESKWFTRGWTLQELMAPRVLVDINWQNVGTKHSLLNEISLITSIPWHLLRESSPLICNVAQRMSWASTRKTTRDEDLAYCLMGLFAVNMEILYGEGLENAFLRLQSAILQRSSD